MHNEDPLVSVLFEFGFCSEAMKDEFLEGLELGFKIAHESTLSNKPFSRELYGYLIRQKVQVFSFNDLFNELKEIPDIVVVADMFVTKVPLLNSEYHGDYVRALSLGYEMAMTAYMKIVGEYDKSSKLSEYIEIYNSTIMTFLNGLKFTRMQVK